MKNYLEITARYFMGQKKRTFLTILGIILSCALITAVGTMTVSLQEKTIEDAKRDRGFYHSMLIGLDQQKAAVLQNHAKLEKTGLSLDAGIGVTQSDDINPYIKLQFYDKDAGEICYTELMEGSLPVKNHEIALEKQFIDGLNRDVSVGDKIPLKIYDSEIGNNLISKEEVEGTKVGELREFTVSGILIRSQGNIGRIPRGFISEEAAKELLKKQGQELKYDAFIRVKGRLPIQKSLSEIADHLDLSDDQRQDNWYLISVLGENKDINNRLYKIAFILAMLIVVATVAVIYNSFHISVLERIKQFGLLRAVGATPKQIRTIVFREAGILSLISIPLGLLSGVVAVKIVVALLNIGRYSLFKGMGVTISLPILAISGLLSIFAVYFSALSPARMAGKVSPIIAIVNLGHEQRIKRIRRAGFFSKLFGIEGSMALRNIGSNKRRYLVTVFSMGMGIAVFLVFNTFIYHAFGITGADVKSKVQMDFTVKDGSSSGSMDRDTGFDEDDYEFIKGIKGVEGVRKNQDLLIHLRLDQSKLDREYVKYMERENIDYYNIEFIDDGTIIAHCSKIIGLAEEDLKTLKEHLVKGSLDPRQMEEEDGVLVLLASEVPSGKMKVYDFKVGNEVSFTNDHFYDKPSDSKEFKTMKITGVVDKLNFEYYANYNAAVFITSQEAFKNITGKHQYDGFDVVVAEDADREQVAQQLKKVAAKAKTPWFYDTKAEDERLRQMKMEISVLLYGFVTVISLIGVLNVVNTINTNLILRRREFGLLQAVGMTRRQMIKMIRLEGVYYWLGAVILGTAAGRGISLLLYREIFSIRRVLNFFDWKAVFFAGAVTLLAVMISIYFPLRRISETSIVDTIRE